MDQAAFEAWQATVRPDPQMVVKEGGYELETLMLQLSEFVEIPAGRKCTSRTSDAYKTHVRRMKTEGWGAKISARVKSYGCSAGSDPLQCFADSAKWPNHPEVVNPALEVPETRIVELGEIGSTNYWTRSSPTGRYIGNGGPARIDDMEKNIRYTIKGAKYDPGFFPDNSGFGFHGEKAIFCSMQALRQTGTAANLTMGGTSWKEYEIDPFANGMCHQSTGENRIVTYQSQGMAMNDLAYVVTGDHYADDGKGYGGGPNIMFYGGNLEVYELEKTANGYTREDVPPTKFSLKGEGDFSLTPSTEYIVGRITGKPGPNKWNTQMGYMLRSLRNMMKQGMDFKMDEDPTLSEYCFLGMGTKPQVSYDERFIVFHQWKDFQNSNGEWNPNPVADIFLIDVMQPEKVYQITDFTKSAGFKGRNRALFPHFRADGWLYFRMEPETAKPVCQENTGLCAPPQTGADTAYMMATDVALRIAKEHPID